LEPLLLEARKLAQQVGAAQPENFVLLNATDFSRPIAETTVKRAWQRVLRAIDITEAEQKERNLVIHGLRHFYATRLVDAGLTPLEAAKMTGHRTLAMLGRYSDHVQTETLRKSKSILDEIKP
jgi:integrase